MNRSTATATALVTAAGLIVAGLGLPTAAHAAPMPVGPPVVTVTPASPVLSSAGGSVTVTLQFYLQRTDLQNVSAGVVLRRQGSAPGQFVAIGETSPWNPYPGLQYAFFKSEIRLPTNAPLGRYDVGVEYTWSSKENCENNQAPGDPGIERCTVWSKLVGIPQAGSLAVRADTNLTVNAGPEPVRKNKKLTVTGALKQYDPAKKKYVALGGTSVGLYFDPKGKKQAVLKARTTTRSNGAFTKKFKATADGRWFARYTSTTTHGPAKSRLDYVNVT